MFELMRLQILVDRVRNFSQRYRFSVLDLLLSEESIALTLVTAVGAVTRTWPLHTRVRSDLEISETFLYRALPADVAFLVRANRNAELIAEIPKVAHAVRLRANASRAIGRPLYVYELLGL